MKKLFTTLALGMACVLTLTSCNDGPAKMEYVDAEGETKTLEIKQTEDKEEVAEVLEAVLNSSVDQKKIDAIKGLTVTANVELSCVVGNEAKATIGAKANAKAAVSYDEKNPGFEATASASTYAKGDESITKLFTVLPNASATVFTQDKNLYASANATLTEGSTTEIKKFTNLENLEKKMKDATTEAKNEYSSIMAEFMPYFSGEGDQDIAQMQQEIMVDLLAMAGYTEAEIETYKTTGYITISESAHQQIVAMVEKLHLTISETTKDTFTLSAEVKMDEESKNAVKAYVTLSSKTLLLVKAGADLGAVVPEMVKTALNQYLPPVVSSLLVTQISECKGTASVTVDYSAKFTKHSTEGYAEVKAEDILGSKEE